MKTNRKRFDIGSPRPGRTVKKMTVTTRNRVSYKPGRAEKPMRPMRRGR